MFAPRPAPDADRAWVRARLLAGAPHLAGDFQRIHARDLRRIGTLYDGRSFDGTLARTLGDTPLTYRVSGRMTRCLGLTYRHLQPLRFEIVVSSTLLFGNFDPADRGVQVVGLDARDRLDALLLVMEHELVHLAELLAFGDSDCAADRFAGIAHGLFGHREHTHRLITPRERAHARGIGVGARVAFEHRGQRHVGVVNRVGRRATVLVPDPKGARYSDGVCYAKFYVPPDALTPADP